MNLRRLLVTVILFAGVCGSSCLPDDAPLLPERTLAASGEELERLARFVHLADTHITDEESPARFAASYQVVSPAWREWECYSTQLMDGTIRAINRLHASGQTIDFLIHAGDAVDNAQGNELDWFMTLMEGGRVDPLSGIDDRPLHARPEPALDPHAPFEAQGLYQQGAHGDWPSIPWYIILGNHDLYATGVFPIVTVAGGKRVAPLPLQPRLGLFLPRILDPTGWLTHGKVTPARPGPPALFTWPVPIVPVAERAYFSRDEFIATMLDSPTRPAGHGFGADGLPWYSTSPLPGLRLIGLFTSDHFNPTVGLAYHEGCISVEQYEWLVGELEASSARGEIIIVASHHGSGVLETLYGTAADPNGFRELLSAFPAVVLHLAAHKHRHLVADRGTYIEIETSSTLDWPQEARLIEIWRDPANGDILIGYDVISHLDDEWPPLGEDPLVELRRQALLLAQKAGTGEEISRPIEGTGGPDDRRGLIRVKRAAGFIPAFPS